MNEYIYIYIYIYIQVHRGAPPGARQNRHLRAPPDHAQRRGAIIYINVI